MAALTLAALGGAKLLGSLISGAMSGRDDWTQGDYEAARSKIFQTLGQLPTEGPYGEAATDAEARLTDITNPWIDHAIGDQDYMRELQEGYTADLLAQAQGAKSYAREESARQEGMQSDILSTMAASTRDRFASPGAQATAAQQQAALHQNMILPTEAAAAEEKNRAQDMLLRVGAGRDMQAQMLMDLERRKRDQQDKIGLYGALQAFGHRRLGGQEARSATMSDVGLAQADATKKR